MAIPIGCKEKNEEPQSTSENEEEVELSGDKLYIIISIDEENKKIIVEDIEEENRIVLEYTGGTSIQNKYGEEMMVSRLEPGEIAQIEYSGGTGKVQKIQISDQIWEYSGVKEFTIDTEQGILETGGKKYSFEENKTLFFSNGLEIEKEEVSEVDEITLRGYETQIFSVTVDKGHGYVVLDNEEAYVGGFVEIGSEVIKEIVNDMVIIAPEGEYILTAAKNGMGGSQPISVLRGEELVVDISRLQTVLEAGSVKFNIVPSSAKLYVDGDFVSHSDPVSLSYGNHSFRITASGYKTLVGRINVNSSYTSKSFVMNLAETDTTQEETEETTATEQITVSAPEGAMVYFDGVLKGMAPISFTKETGSHTITLRQTGFESVSYTVYISDDGEDAELSFEELVESE
jgi:hypothetical protein